MSVVFNTHYFYVTKLICSMVGLWPYQSQFRRKVLISFNFFVMFSFALPQLKRLFHVLGKDIDAVCMGIPPLFTLLLSVIKNVIIIRFKSEIKSLLNQVETEWEGTSKREEHTILMNYASKTKGFCMIYTVFMLGGLICFILMPTISPMLDVVSPRNETRERYLGFDLDYGIDLQTFWVWLWMHTSIAGTVVILNYIAADTMYITLLFHGCYMFAIAKHKLLHVTDTLKKSTKQSFKYRDYNTKRNTWRHGGRRLELEEQSIAIKECVLSHKKAIECAQLLHCIYMWFLFAAAGTNVISISISSVQLVSKLFRWAEMAMSGVFVIGELTHLFFLSLMAQFILDQSLDVHESAYTCFWYNLPVEIQKNIIFVLIRSRSSCKMTAGKMFVMSLESFCTIVQTSMSYFTVLASFR